MSNSALNLQFPPVSAVRFRSLNSCQLGNPPVRWRVFRIDVSEGHFLFFGVVLFSSSSLSGEPFIEHSLDSDMFTLHLFRVDIVAAEKRTMPEALLLDHDSCTSMSIQAEHVMDLFTFL